MRIFFQLAIVLLSLVGLGGVIRKRRSHLFSPLGALFWGVFWVGLGSLVSMPDVTQKIADIIGIGRGVDLVIYVAVSMIFFLLFKFHIKLEKIQREVTEVARREALRDVSTEKNK